ncbi:protein phosphatase 1 regulatory subunit 1B-like isoform X2 [Melanotaenia boesemani]|uniref:protein phosphatase 1 regulatory subunit 1B-like isoform X2 n=1 Tax=Melanotaenia boesemani TaxID=1250792 RepID=UPI001C059737|nr:protein phosphatase 1 regulatory subunit 1B-like isoform X2 [Melanotaenia boesemani]
MEPEVMDREADKDARRKIQFSVPSSIPLQLDPRQVEMIRRRRPTPATLFRLTDPPSPEEESGSHQWVLGENGALKAKLVHMSAYQPPSLKAVQKMAQAHLSSLDMKSVDGEEPSSGEEEEQQEEEAQQTASATNPREESRSSRDPCHQLDSSAARSELSHRHDAKDKTTESKEVQGK